MSLFKLFFLSFTLFLSCTDRSNNKVISEANRAYERKDYISAILLFNDLLTHDSTNGEYYYKRGYSYSMLFNVEDAVNDYKKAIDYGYRVADAYNNIGINYSTIDDSLAIVNFNKAKAKGYDEKKIYKRIEDCKKRLNTTKTVR